MEPIKIYKHGYDYSACSICGTEDISDSKIVVMSEVYYESFIDSSGAKHIHNENYGTIQVTCVNGHITEQEFIPVCECGWKNTATSH